MTKPKYTPAYQVPDQAVNAELQRLAAALNDPELYIPVHSEEPSKPRDGQVVWADGTSWDPAATGERTLLIYDATAEAFLPLGSGSGGTPGGGTSDHGLLTGLLDDDHPQYLTIERGDARYYSRAAGEDNNSSINDLNVSISILQSGLQDAVDDILALSPRVDSLETIQAQHAQDITNLETVYGDTASAASSAAAAAASQAAAAASAAAALLSEQDAEVARDAAVAAQTAAEGHAGTAGSSATTAVNAASAAGTSADEAEAAATAALASEVASESWANVAQDAAQGGVTVDAAPGALWKFDADLESWTSSNPTATWESGGYLQQGGGSDPILQSPTIAVPGADYGFVVIRIRRNSGSGWQGRVRYSTAGHSFSASYEVTKSEPNWVGTTWQTVSFDMRGVADWLASTITAIQLELGSDGGTAEYDIDWIAVGNDVATLASAAAASALEAATFASDAESYAVAAETSSLAAASSASGAASSATAANSSASTAASHASDAEASASAANTSRIAAETAETNAELAQTAAVTAKEDAEDAAAAATSSQTAAANSATAAGNSATAASNSATAAQTSATNAASSASAASSSAQQAAASAQSSGNSASAANISAQLAEGYADDAGSSALAASGSASTAQTSSSSAQAYAGQAAQSATNAANSAFSAGTSATSAGNSAATATTQASNATSSASQAANSASLAAAYRDQVIPVNPLNRVGDTSKWTNVLDVALRSAGARLVYAGNIQSAANLQATTAWFPVDQAAIYEVRVSALKSQVLGRFYIGLHASTDGVNNNSTTVPIRDQVVVAAGSTNEYWAFTPLGTSYNSQWYDFVLYIVGSAVAANECPDGLVNGAEIPAAWSNRYDGLQLQPDALFARLRILNWDNGGTTTNLFVTNVFVTRVDNQKTAALKQEFTVLSTAIAQEAQARLSLTTRVDDNEANITELFESIDGIQVSWTVQVEVDANGNRRVGGIQLYGDPNRLDFVVYVDRFAVATPTQPGAPPRFPFVVGSVGGVSTVGIDGNLVVDGSIATRHIRVSDFNPTNNGFSINLTGRQLSIQSANYQRILGWDFGTAGEFVDYYGPTGQAISKANARFYLNRSGEAYFAGLLNKYLVPTAWATVVQSTVAPYNVTVYENFNLVPLNVPGENGIGSFHLYFPGRFPDGTYYHVVATVNHAGGISALPVAPQFIAIDGRDLGGFSAQRSSFRVNTWHAAGNRSAGHAITVVVYCLRPWNADMWLGPPPGSGGV